MLILLLFFHVFAFSIFKSEFINSSILAGVILCIYFLLSSSYRRVFSSLFLNKRVFFIFVSLLIIISYSTFQATIHLTYDYSIVKTFISQFINLVISLLVFTLYVLKDKEKTLMKDIIYIFIIQSLIQLLSFSFPQLNELLNAFRSEGAIIRGQEGYGNIRGLAISGSAFYGLSISYGLIYIYFIVYWKELFQKYKVMKYVSFGLLLFGGMSAGRISMVGLVIGFVYVTINKILQKQNIFRISKRIKLSSVFGSFLLIIVVGMSIYYVTASEVLMTRIDTMTKYAFQLFYNYKETGGFSTSSTDALFNEMYFDLDNLTLLFGDGFYTNADGTYYQNTDAGYMRNLLFYGIGGVLALFIYQLTFFKWEKNETLLLNVFIVAYILIIHVKGDALGFSIMLQNILFLKFLYNYKYTAKNMKDNLVKTPKRVIAFEK